MRIIVPILLLSGTLSVNALDFQGAGDRVVEIAPEASTGLEGIFVLRNASGVGVSWPSANVSWSVFGAAGAAYAEQVSAPGGVLTLQGGDCGIMAEADGRQYCYWIVDYSRHEFLLNGVTASDGDYACDNVQLTVQGSADAIRYYTINGREMTLDRDITVTYPTLVFDKDAVRYVQAENSVSLPYIGASTHIAAPLCDTRFTVEGDRFLRAWDEALSAVSAEYRAVAVAASTSAEQTERTAENEQKPSTESLGGSAPCEISFAAEITDAVAFTEWQISRTPDFDILENSYNQTEFTHTFTENGTIYVRFIAANADATCEYTGETYEVSIGESKLLCPNAFTPYTSPGVNDEWRVSYQSIVEFKCDIFNRWGTKMITLTDPSQGWDGKYGGKNAGQGVYYYVIRARGADGKEYKLSGDINIIGSREYSGTGAAAE